MEFLYESHPNRVIFGSGTVKQVSDELRRMNGNKALVICTPGRIKQAEKIANLLGDLCVEVYAEAVQHVPVPTVEKSLEKLQGLQVDSLVAIGGGSSVGLAKAIALKTGLPILAIPTTYSGSELTAVWGMTENGKKTTGKDMKVKPKTVIFDPDLTLGLPSKISVTSGMNAMAHCVEALYTENKNPISSLMAEEGIRALYSSLPMLQNNPKNIEARSEALYGAWLAGTVLSSVGMAVHHKLCHVLGGSFNLPHAEVHTLILPYAISYNQDYVPDAMRSMAKVLDTNEEDVAGTIFDLNYSMGVTMSLSELGLKESDVEHATELVTTEPYYNPRPIEKTAIKELLLSAFNGVRP